jgi:hypothetical protein
MQMPEITAQSLRLPCNNAIIVPPLPLFVQVLINLKNSIWHCNEALHAVGLPCLLSLGPVVVGRFFAAAQCFAQLCA